MSEEKHVRIIEVVPHDSRWDEEYLREAELIKGVMKNEIVVIYHIGSTSIPGIYAKPIIDILIEVNDINKIDNYNKLMESVGYIAKGENGIEGRRYFIKGLYNRTHHIHVFQTGNSGITRHLNFRDYMIAHPEEAKYYEELKKELAARFRYDSEGYTDGKDAYIKEIDKKAKIWANKK
jgi:GrpB-like predicted nucleotidyltransferase (UPF0157 family)